MSSGSNISSAEHDPSGVPPGGLADWVSDWGAVTINSIMAVGDMAYFSWRTISWMLFRLPRKSTLLPVFYQVGVLSLPVVALTGTFIGMVLAVQTYYHFRQLNMETELGAVINMVAELGTMRVTEQIDALASMGANPIRYLVVPRFIAFLFLIPALTVMAIFMGVVGGYFYSVIILSVDKHHYLYNAQEFVGTFDLFSGIFKSVFFGIAIALVSCYQGFNCRPGAEGVGKAATAAFVHSFVLILALDLLLAITLDSIYYMVWPEGASLF